MKPSKTENRFQILGVNDDRDFCECCGKQGLSRVVWIEDKETGEIRHFGTTCATSPAKGFDLEKQIKSAIRKFRSIIEQRWRKAMRIYRDQGGKMEQFTDKQGCPGIRVADRLAYEAILNKL